MKILKEATWFIVTFLVVSSESRPIAVHNYAPAHEYKSTDYSFSYGVKDLHTGDVKNQWEKKTGNVVKGQYSVLEPDGSTRIVDYTADDKNGFNAVVNFDRHFVHPITVPKEATSHNNLHMESEKQAPITYSYYKTDTDEKYPKSHSEIQSIIQHPYKYPKSYSELKNTAEYENHEVQNEEQVKTTYVYVPKLEENEDKEETADEEQEKTFYTYGSNQKQQLQTVEDEKEENSDVDGEYSVSEIQTHVPALDLKKLPVDVSLLNPVKIDLTKTSNENAETTVRYSTKDNSVQPSHQFTPEEVEKFLEDLKNNNLSEPVYETGFVPITSKPNHLITQPMLPNTYKSNLKVNSTPGLKHYASRGNSKFKRNKYGQKLLPLFYPAGEVRKETHRSEYTRLYRSPPSVRNPFVRYAKHIRFVDN